MAAFIASYAGPTGQRRTVTVNATNEAEAKCCSAEESAPMNCASEQ